MEVREDRIKIQQKDEREMGKFKVDLIWQESQLNLNQFSAHFSDVALHNFT